MSEAIDNFPAGLTEIASKLRKGGIKQNAGCAAFVLRARERIEELEAVLASREQDSLIADALRREAINVRTLAKYRMRMQGQDGLTIQLESQAAGLEAILRSADQPAKGKA